VRFEFEFGIVLFCFSFIFVSFGESRLLVSWCAGGRCGMTCSDEDHGRSRRLVQRTGDGRTCWDSVTGRSRGWVVPCAVCIVHVETRSVGFLVEPQKKGQQSVSGLASKPVGRFSPVWPQNWWQRFLAVWSQNVLRQFSPVWPQNWWRRFLPLWPQNRWSVSLSLKTKVVEDFPFGPQN
jgi:hypothetical protein